MMKCKCYAFIKLINSNSNKWKPLYNLGLRDSYTVTQIAEKILDIAEKNKLKSSSKLVYVEKGDILVQNLDSSLFNKEFKWK